MARYGCTIEVDTGEMPSSQTDFTWLATEDNFPTAAIDGGGASILNGGGNLRCYTDDTKTTQLPIEVVTFVAGGTPSVQVWGLSPTLNVASTVYIEADTVAISQPAVTDTYGRNAAWSASEAVYHLDEDPANSSPQYTDSTGNGNDGSQSGVSLISGVIGNAAGFNGTTSEIDCGTDPSLELKDFTISAWVNPTTLGGASDILWSKSDDIFAGGLEVAITSSGMRVAWKDGITIRGWYESGQAVTVGSWQLLTVVRDSSTGDVSFYSDGSFITTIATGQTGAIAYNSDSALIGYQTQNTRLNGGMDELQLSSFTTGSDAILSQYNNQSDPSTFWVTGAWEDQDSGGIIIPVIMNQLRNQGIQ